MATVFERVQKIIAEQLGVEDSEIKPETSFVDDLNAEQSRLESAGVEFIRTAGKEEWGGVISTFVDPDGNYGQLIEFTPPGS